MKFILFVSHIALFCILAESILIRYVTKVYIGRYENTCFKFTFKISIVCQQCLHVTLFRP